MMNKLDHNEAIWCDDRDRQRFLKCLEVGKELEEMARNPPELVSGGSEMQTAMDRLDGPE